MQNVYILSAVRTAIGAYSGSLKNVPTCDLATTVIAEAIDRAKLDPKTVEQCVLGSVLHGEARDMYISRVAAINAGMAESSRSLTVNRLCGSGLQAVLTATQQIQLDDVNIAVAGGAESMSRAGYLMSAHRWGKRMGDDAIIDMMVGVLTDPFGHGHMGVTAENIAKADEIGRDRQDAFSLESHHRAERAIKEGRFKDQIVDVVADQRKGTIFNVDEHTRLGAQLADFEKLRPVFQKDGTVTAGNASGINDGAAAITLASEKMVKDQGLTPEGRIVSYGNAGVKPEVMGLGPVEAVQQALARADLSLSDIDVIESNEAFAVQALAVSDQLGFDSEKVNINGGAVALGHPVGATGAILLVKALYELKRTGGRYGLITMCIGGGQGICLIIENC
ncbi:beta-ketothiolase BktB [Terasakiella sp. A23]|uniref:beta-ketothiolase BktB n=1 Tax=Terasakiella sp. FCG-A23 TaxID=3080561 RepID=UPI00295490EA|nr:beta-ketothiolase BktB [Terasakiella sp. A23]MDV7340606.1 beta-ketothiolase BktB [Terasakiella sp. A23]